MLQIVDIALKAISPAVNDPSTVISCVDQLSSILIRYAAREDTQTHLYDPPGTLRVFIPHLGFERLVESAFEQIRMYARTDVAVSLRLLRAFGDISLTLTDAAGRELLANHGRRLVAGFTGWPNEDGVSTEMKQRLTSLETLATAKRSG